ncbi:hypothetical protein ENH_00041360, partial [Eimeria necatrix]
MQDIVEPNEEAADYPMESPRREPDHCIDLPTAGMARSAPRVWFRDIGGSKEPVGDQAWVDPGLTEFLRELAAQMARGVVQASQRSIGYEDGKNMRDFLDLAELDFIERGLEERLITLERMKVMIAKNVWRGDHHAYSARFADIVAQGVSVAPDMLVGYYLANLPGEILREVTRGGTRRFADWREAAAALAAMAAPWKDLCEDHHRFRRDLEDATRRWAKGEREPDLLRERENRDDRGNDASDPRCYACSGRGHFPEFLTHVLYTHHDHVTAGHRGQKKTYKAL